MDPTSVLLLVSAALLAGALNAVAGGASFFSFPALMLAGLPPISANATNFVALTPSSFTALPAFREELRDLGVQILRPVFVGTVGGALGSILLLKFGGGVFETLVPWLLAMATLLFALAPHLNAWLGGVNLIETRPVLALSALFLFSIYGGYFGAGIGKIMLAALVFAGFTELSRANALKNAVVSGMSLVAFGIYAASGIVYWPFAFIMMLGAAIGGYAGARLSRRVPQNVIRYGVIGFGSFLSLYYFTFGVH